MEKYNQEEIVKSNKWVRPHREKAKTPSGTKKHRLCFDCKHFRVAKESFSRMCIKHPQDIIYGRMVPEELKAHLNPIEASYLRVDPCPEWLKEPGRTQADLCPDYQTCSRLNNEFKNDPPEGDGHHPACARHDLKGEKLCGCTGRQG